MRNSQTIDRIEHFSRSELFKLVNSLTPKQQQFFIDMYSSDNPTVSIRELVFNIFPQENIDWAIVQCENTLRKNSQKEELTGD